VSRRQPVLRNRFRNTIVHDVTGAPLGARMAPGGGDPAQGGGGWPWVLSDLKSPLETGERMPT
jgi:hypothetical protein